MIKKNHVPPPFRVRDCAVTAIATGRRAQTLRDLLNHLKAVEEGSIYYHLWGSRVRPVFTDRDYYNDFSSWAETALDDKVLGERLGAVNPADFENLDMLRREMVEIISERLDELQHVPWCKLDKQFHFIRSQIVVFDTGVAVDHPRRLPSLVTRFSQSSLFYHFIDARRRNPDGLDDFTTWLTDWGPEFAESTRLLKEIDPYFAPLPDIRVELSWIFRHSIDTQKRRKKGASE